MGLGRGELRQGRTLDALQSAYRVGARGLATDGGGRAPRRARVRSAEPAGRVDLRLHRGALGGLGRGLHGGAGPARGRATARRRELAPCLLREPPADEADLRAAADAGGWTVPRTVAALACSERELERLARRPPVDTSPWRSTGWLRDRRRTRRAPAASASWPRRASAARGARVAGPLRRAGRLVVACPAGPGGRARPARSTAGAGLVQADDHLVEGSCSTATARSWSRWPGAGSRRSRRSPRRRARMRATALAYLEQHGNAAAMAWPSTSIRRPRATGWHACATCWATTSTTRQRASSSSWRCGRHRPSPRPRRDSLHR